MRSIWRTLDRDLARGIAVICLSVAVIGVSYGATAVTSGFPLWVPVATAVVVFAGSSEFLFVGVIAAGGSPVAAVLAGLLVNARHVTYGLALPDVIEPGWRRLAGSHLMNDESVVLALSQPDPARRRAVYWISGIGLLLCWPAGALAGALAGGALRDPDALGLDAMFPAAILALILPALRAKTSRRAALAGAAIALAAAPLLPAGLPELLALGGLVVTVRRRAAA
ncbi:MAG TPA: AzlC family ABC transporter permease [Streptosporangiaceae bacterium]|nr:AzlC family ABC transporter permease [Streptosporangiaceae bacterium]